MKLKVKPVIRLAPHSYKLYFSKYVVTDEQNAGTINRRTQTIIIDVSLALSQKEVTFWHETFHELGANFRLNLPDDVIDNLAVGLTQFLQENFDIELDFSDIKMKEE